MHGDDRPVLPAPSQGHEMPCPCARTWACADVHSKKLVWNPCVCARVRAGIRVRTCVSICAFSRFACSLTPYAHPFSASMSTCVHVSADEGMDVFDMQVLAERVASWRRPARELPVAYVPDQTAHQLLFVFAPGIPIFGNLTQGFLCCRQFSLPGQQFFDS
jgi:hypothetical protein